MSDLENTPAKDEGKLAMLRPTSSLGIPAVTALQAEVASLKHQVATIRREVSAYPKKCLRMNALTLCQRMAEDSCESFVKRYEQARVNEFATVNEIRIGSRAVAGLNPVKPLKSLFAGLSFAVALVVATGWALFAEYVDPQVRTISDPEDELGTPGLGAIPTLKCSWSQVGA